MDVIRVAKVLSPFQAIPHPYSRAHSTDQWVFHEQVESVILDKAGRRTEGILHLTPHHLIFTLPDNTEEWVSPRLHANPPKTTLTTLSLLFPIHSFNLNQPSQTPYPHISTLHRLPLTHTNLSPVHIRTRTFDSFIFLFKKEREAEDVWTSVRDLCLVCKSRI